MEIALSEMSFGMFPMPPEIQEAMQRQHDLRQMHMETAKHDLYTWIKSMDRESSDQFFALICAVSIGSDSELAKHLRGYMEGVREAKWGICPPCQINHDEQAQEVLKEGASTVSEDSSTPTQPYILTQQDLDDMEEYNLDDLRDIDTHQLLGFVCKGCGMRYISIADRKLRKPGIDGCSGCQLRSAHG